MEKKSYVVAIDIGSSEVVVAVASLVEGGNLAIETIVTEPTKEGMTAGMVDNSQLVADALRRAREKAEQQVGIAITDAYVGISGKFVRCARYTDHVFVEDAENRISQRDLAALGERMRNVKAADGEVIMDLYPLNYKGDTGAEMKNPVGCYSKQLSSTYNFILCEHVAKDRLRRVFLDVGIKIREIFAGAAVVADSIVTSDEKEDGIAVVDLGGGVTDVAIYHGGVLGYMASIPIGGAVVNADIRCFNGHIPPRTIESLKRQCGSAVVDLTPDEVIQVRSRSRAIKPIARLNLAAVIEARMTDIAEYVWNEIRDSGYAKKLGAGIVLTGGVADLQNVAELFHRVTGQEVRTACAEIGIQTESLEKVSTPNLTLAVSLLLRGAKAGACPYGVYVPPIKSEPKAEPKPEAKAPVQEPVAKPAEKAAPKVAETAKPAEQPTPQPAPKAAPAVEDEDDITDGTDDIVKPSGLSRLGSWFKRALSDAFPAPDEDGDSDDEY